MGGKFGTKETEEVVNAIGVAVVAVVRAAKKDGWQVSDLGAFLKSPEFEAALAPALAGIENVPAELTELDLRDDFAIGRFAYTVAERVIDELKKPAA